MDCDICGVNGAGLSCFEKDCQRTFHYKCALENPRKCLLNVFAWEMYCSEHAADFFRKFPEFYEDPWVCQVCDVDENDDKVILCDECDLGFHIYC